MIFKMTLFLTSDEEVYGSINTRTSFDNCIKQDFFTEDGNNVALKEIFFDAKFPTLINNSLPHAITIIDGREHDINEFPEKFKKNSSFVALFSKNKRKHREKAFMRVEKDFITSSSILADVESNLVVEIHPRLNYAMVCGFLTDLTINTKEEVVNYLNKELFPFHKVKPLKITSTGQIYIKSNLNIFLSSNIINILGFSPSQRTDPIHQMIFPSDEIVKRVSNYIENDEEWLNFDDELARLEYESDIYTNYRRLISEKPVGRIAIEYFDGIQQRKVESHLSIELFHHREVMWMYKTELRFINRVLLHTFTQRVKEDALSELALGLSWLKEEGKDLDARIRGVLNDRDWRKGVGGLATGFGGLVTLKIDGEHVILTPLHSEKCKRRLREKIDGINDPLLRNVFTNTFPNVEVRKISFNDTLCKLLGATTSSIEFNRNGDDVRLSEKIDYFKSMRYELFNSYENKTPFALDFLTNRERFETEDEYTLCAVKTQSENAFLIKKHVEYFADQPFNIYSNFPKLMFITANFIESSLFGSTQQNILNFFPISMKHMGMLHHRFDNPIVLKMIPNSVFHIKLLDQNLSPLKAGLGVPTLLTVKKTSNENMFPVTVISSDHENKILFPENRHNCFKNKLSFPLLFSNKSEWRVSLRSLAFPKVKNIQSDVCKILFKSLNEKREWTLNFDSSFVTDVNNIVFLLNSKIKEIFDGVDDIILPKFLTNENQSMILLESNGVNCYLDGDMMRLLGFSFSHPKELTEFIENGKYSGVTSPNIFLFQPQEIMIISNIVEEAYYAQSRPNILRIVPIPNQQEVNGYNYVQFEQHDDIGIKLDRIDDIEIKILTRKGKFVDFVDECDVKLQLEFKQIKNQI